MELLDSLNQSRQLTLMFVVRQSSQKGHFLLLLNSVVEADKEVLLFPVLGSPRHESLPT